MSQWLFVLHNDAKLLEELRNEALTMDACRFANSIIATHSDGKCFLHVAGVDYDLWVNSGVERATAVLEQLIKKLGKETVTQAIYELAESEMVPAIGMYDFVKQVATACDLDEEVCLHGTAN